MLFFHLADLNWHNLIAKLLKSPGSFNDSFAILQQPKHFDIWITSISIKTSATNMASAMKQLPWPDETKLFSGVSIEPKDRPSM